jgi:hypothetical protein
MLVNDKIVLFPGPLVELVSRGVIDATGKTWGAWQDLLRREAYQNQQGLSLLTGRELNIKTMQLHHALISKGRIRGMKGLKRNLIHHTYNCMLLNADEHIGGQVSAENSKLCAKKLCELYGENEVKKWYFSFPLKTKLKNIF